MTFRFSKGRIAIRSSSVKAPIFADPSTVVDLYYKVRDILEYKQSLVTGNCSNNDHWCPLHLHIKTFMM